MSKNEQNAIADQELDGLVGGAINAPNFNDFQNEAMAKYKADAEEGGYTIDIYKCRLQIAIDFDEKLAKMDPQ
jgi:hypothetical protein